MLTLTVLLRALTFPLQTKSYRSMNKMKDLAPKMEELKQKFGTVANIRKASLDELTTAVGEQLAWTIKQSLE